ncbi:hypothetical protein H5407_23305 [Mitsuaria sp. WAJ17]|uniref:hypothetical protein n=1 Tax=Mitsuaria sp. WAJ17 TaxID=2761452 RepID=UPI0015FEE8FB|nr:hypothetical protein [Mitsuaria sp. WAJ17]MBB2488166.1 hypothetical protein [Mitsuaria sp. WAJ17]
MTAEENFGKVSSSFVDRREEWVRCADSLARLDCISRDGASVVVKMDGERDADMYTVVVSGGALGEDFFRRNGANVSELLEAAISFYVGMKG